MLRSKALLAILTISLFISSISAGPAFLQNTQDGKFFEQTGHWVKGAFLEYFNRATDPYLVFGYPITEEMPHQLKQGYTVQYFQRARMERDDQGNMNVQLAPLGEYLYDNLQHGEKADFSMSNGACRVFQKTGKPVCYAFLQFYDAYQGSIYFGDPISDVEILDNRLVQYFTYARMEWRPENEPGKRVALTDIGRLYFDISEGNGDLTLPSENIPEGTPTTIQVYAFPDRPLATSGSRQKIFVIVRDQYMNPVKNAQVKVEVISSGGKVDNYRPDVNTNEDGLVEVSFDINGLQPNDTVRVIARANKVGGTEKSAETMF